MHDDFSNFSFLLGCRVFYNILGYDLFTLDLATFLLIGGHIHCPTGEKHLHFITLDVVHLFDFDQGINTNTESTVEFRYTMIWYTITLFHGLHVAPHSL